VRPFLVGIAGGSGSGKSSVARRLADALRGASVVTLDMDAYYRNLTHLTLEQRRHVNWDHPDAFDVDLLLDQLAALAERRAIEKPVYDYVAHVRAPRAERVEPADVILVDGILLFADPRVRARCDLKVFVDVEPDLRLLRRIRRDMRVRGRPLEEILDQYLTKVRPMHLEFVEPTKQFADVVVSEGAHNEPAIAALVARIRSARTGVPA
jgi:uridine kinase